MQIFGSLEDHARLVDGSVIKCDIKMPDFKFFFINDTNQGPALTYNRLQAPLEASEALNITTGTITFIHFTIKDGNFRKVGDESDATSINGVGYLQIIFDTKVDTYPIHAFTYYTNGGVKECYFRCGADSGTFFHYRPS